MSENKPTVYVSVDVEAEGTSPCTSSCTMIGAVVVKDMEITPEMALTDWVIVRKQWCLKRIAGRPMEERCKTEFWDKHPELLDYINKNARDPIIVMEDFANWYADLLSKYKCIFIARPASYDWQWINCLYDEFAPKIKPSLPFSIVCISSILKVFDWLNIDWDTVIKPLIDHQVLKVTHYADDDALYQAYMFLRVKYWLTKNLYYPKPSNGEPKFRKQSAIRG